MELDDWSLNKYTPTLLKQQDRERDGEEEEEEERDEEEEEDNVEAKASPSGRDAVKGGKGGRAWCLAESLSGSVYLYSLLPTSQTTPSTIPSANLKHKNFDFSIHSTADAAREGKMG